MKHKIVIYFLSIQHKNDIRMPWKDATSCPAEGAKAR